MCIVFDKLWLLLQIHAKKRSACWYNTHSVWIPERCFRRQAELLHRCSAGRSFPENRPNLVPLPESSLPMPLRRRFRGLSQIHHPAIVMHLNPCCGGGKVGDCLPRSSGGLSCRGVSRSHPNMTFAAGQEMKKILSWPEGPGKRLAGNGKKIHFYFTNGLFCSTIRDKRSRFGGAEGCSDSPRSPQ